MEEGRDIIDTLALYHYPCTDGAFAALAAYLSNRGEQCAFIPHSTTRALDVLALRKRFPHHLVVVHMLDYCGPGIPFMRQLCEAFSEVLLTDHHKTAQEMLDTMEAAGVYPRNLNAHVEQDRSGCALARDYYKPTLDRNLDAVFLYVEDNDLWKHALPDSKAFTAGLGALKLEYDFDAHPEALEKLKAVSFIDVMTRGRAELDARTTWVEEAIKRATLRAIIPWALISPLTLTQTFVYESPDDSVIAYASELGNQMAKQSPSNVAIITWPLDKEGRPGWVKLSLRSVDGIDTTVFTKAHGGGGHAAASGCVMEQAAWDAIKN